MTLPGDVDAAVSEPKASQPAARALATFRALPWPAVCFVALMAFALGIRLYRLGSVPSNATADESGFLRDAWHVLAGTGPGLFGFDWTQSPAFSVYLMAGTMKVFGESTVIGIRMCPVLLSMGALAAFFFLARETLSRGASLLAMLLLASNVWFLHFSRTAWTNMNSSLFAIAGALMLTLAIRKGKWYFYAAAGVIAAFGLYGYYSGRLIIALFVVYLPIALLLNRQKARPILRGYGILLISCFLVSLPQIKPVLDNWHSVNARIDTTNIFQVNTPYWGETEMWRILARQVVWAGRAFILIDAGSVMQHGLWARYIEPGHGLLDPLARLLFLAGLAAGAWRWRQTALWWVMFLGPVFTVQVLSDGTPDAARGLIVAPFMFLFVGAGIDLVLEAGRRASVRMRGAGVGALALVAGCSLVFAGADVRQYFDWMGTDAALRARQPAISREVYPAWQGFERVAAKEGPLPFDFYRYCMGQDLGDTEDTPTARLCRDAAPEATGGGWQTDPMKRDVQRVGDLTLLAEALGTYREKYGAFPSTEDAIQSGCAYAELDAACKLHEFVEPLQGGENLMTRTQTYWYRSDGLRFTLYASLEGAREGIALCPEKPETLSATPNLYCVSGP